MSALERQPTEINELTTVKFRFQIQKIPHVNYFVQEVNIPGLKLGIAYQNTQLNRLPLPGNRVDFPLFNITYLADERLENYIEIHKWISEIGHAKDWTQYASAYYRNRETNPQFGDILDTAILHVLTNENNPIVNVIFEDAFPVHLSDLQFRTTDTRSVPMPVEVTFAYATYRFEYPRV